MLRVGVVSEGVSDFLILCEVMRQLRPDAEYINLHPPRDNSSTLGQGWMGVRGWCTRYGANLETFMAEFSGNPLHLLIIHADCSMAKEVGAGRPCPPPADAAGALAKVIDETWLRRVPRPPFVVLALPSMTTDTWAVATLDPPYTNLAAIECDRAAEDQLTKSVWGEIRPLRLRPKQAGIKHRGVKKSASAYTPFAERVGLNLPLVLTLCPQAQAFRADFDRAVIGIPTI